MKYSGEGAIPPHEKPLSMEEFIAKHSFERRYTNRKDGMEASFQDFLKELAKAKGSSNNYVIVGARAFGRKGLAHGYVALEKNSCNPEQLEAFLQKYAGVFFDDIFCVTYNARPISSKGNVDLKEATTAQPMIRDSGAITISSRRPLSFIGKNSTTCKNLEAALRTKTRVFVNSMDQVRLELRGRSPVFATPQERAADEQEEERFELTFEQANVIEKAGTPEERERLHTYKQALQDAVVDTTKIIEDAGRSNTTVGHTHYFRPGTLSLLKKERKELLAIIQTLKDKFAAYTKQRDHFKEEFTAENPGLGWHNSFFDVPGQAENVKETQSLLNAYIGKYMATLDRPETGNFVHFDSQQYDYYDRFGLSLLNKYSLLLAKESPQYRLELQKAAEHAGCTLWIDPNYDKRIMFIIPPAAERKERAALYPELAALRDQHNEAPDIAWGAHNVQITPDTETVKVEKLTPDGMMTLGGKAERTYSTYEIISLPDQPTKTAQEPVQQFKISEVAHRQDYTSESLYQEQLPVERIVPEQFDLYFEHLRFTGTDEQFAKVRQYIEKRGDMWLGIRVDPEHKILYTAKKQSLYEYAKEHGELIYNSEKAVVYLTHYGHIYFSKNDEGSVSSDGIPLRKGSNPESIVDPYGAPNASYRDTWQEQQQDAKMKPGHVWDRTYLGNMEVWPKPTPEEPVEVALVEEPQDSFTPPKIPGVRWDLLPYSIQELVKQFEGKSGYYGRTSLLGQLSRAITTGSYATKRELYALVQTFRHYNPPKGKDGHWGEAGFPNIPDFKASESLDTPLSPEKLKTYVERVVQKAVLSLVLQSAFTSDEASQKSSKLLNEVSTLLAEQPEQLTVRDLNQIQQKFKLLKPKELQRQFTQELKSLGFAKKRVSNLSSVYAQHITELVQALTDAVTDPEFKSEVSAALEDQPTSQRLITVCRTLASLSDTIGGLFSVDQLSEFSLEEIEYEVAYAILEA